MMIVLIENDDFRCDPVEDISVVFFTQVMGMQVRFNVDLTVDFLLTLIDFAQILIGTS